MSNYAPKNYTISNYVNYEELVFMKCKYELIQTKIRSGWYLQMHMIVNGCSHKSWKVIIHWCKKKYANISWIQITMYICDVSPKNGVDMWTKLENKCKSELNCVLDEVEK